MTFEQDVAQRAGISLDQVRSVLLERGVRPSAQLPAPVSMAVTRVQFWGTKQIDGVDQPFAFDQAFEPGLWCVSSSRNLAGKSTVLNVVLAAIRGQLQLSATVRGWMEEFHVELMLDGKPLVVEAETRSTTVSGRAITRQRGGGVSNAAEWKPRCLNSSWNSSRWRRNRIGTRAKSRPGQWGGVHTAAHSSSRRMSPRPYSARGHWSTTGGNLAAVRRDSVGAERAQARVALNAHRAATQRLAHARQGRPRSSGRPVVKALRRR